MTESDFLTAIQLDRQIVQAPAPAAPSAGQREAVMSNGSPDFSDRTITRTPSLIATAIFGGLVAPILAYIALAYDAGFGVSMLVGTVLGAVSFVCSLFVSPETKGKVLVPDLLLA